jgi:hypothetical protein
MFLNLIAGSAGNREKIKSGKIDNKGCSSLHPLISVTPEKTDENTCAALGKEILPD